jgi:hypothetical protein
MPDFLTACDAFGMMLAFCESSVASGKAKAQRQKYDGNRS